MLEYDQEKHFARLPYENAIPQRNYQKRAFICFLQLRELADLMEIIRNLFTFFIFEEITLENSANQRRRHERLNQSNYAFRQFYFLLATYNLKLVNMRALQTPEASTLPSCLFQ